MSRAQPSILSFFQPRQPNYAPPPAQRQAPPAQHDTRSTAPPPPAPPAVPAPQLVPIAPAPPKHTVPPPAPARSSIHPQASIAPIQEQHVPALRRINSLLLPVNYSDSFYRGILDPAVTGLFSRAILWHDDSPSAAEPKVIGGIVCRLEPNPFVAPPSSPSPQGPLGAAASHAIYIQSLSLLSPYRSYGLAAAALEDVLAAGAQFDVATVFAHVWTENADGLAWYAARGFARHGAAPVAGYYFKLRPDTAWVVRREVGPGRGGGIPAPVYAAVVPAPPASVTAEAANLPPLSQAAPAAQAASSASPSPAPSASSASLSFQNARPEREWNDLPAEMMVGPASAASSARSSRHNLLSPPPGGTGSGASSRSSSTARKKRDRAYPAAAFGS